MGFGTTTITVDNVDWSGLVRGKDGHTTAVEVFDVDVEEAGGRGGLGCVGHC